MKEEIIRSYYDNGQLHYETPYLNGKKHGVKKVWDDNGKLWYEMPYKNDLQHGARIHFKY